MTIVIEVTPLKDNQEISFHDLQLFHSGCAYGNMSKHRRPDSGAFLLKCGCGLEIELPDELGAREEIIKTAIDEQSRILASGSFSSSKGEKVTITVRTIV